MNPNGESLFDTLLRKGGLAARESRSGWNGARFLSCGYQLLFRTIKIC